MDKVYRPMIWFKKEDGIYHELSTRFYDLSIMLQRFLNECYDGKKIRFFNIMLGTKEYFEIPGELPVNYSVSVQGDIVHYGLIDLDMVRIADQKRSYSYVWDLVCEGIENAAVKGKNPELLKALQCVRQKAVESNLNTDFVLMKNDAQIGNDHIEAAVWIIFGDFTMNGVLKVKKNGTLIIEKDFVQARKGIEAFLESFKALDIQNGEVVVRGKKDVEFLPVRVSIT